MDPRRTAVVTLACMTAAAFLLSAEVSYAQTRVGVTASVKNQVEGTRAGATRALQDGSDIHAQERIRTADASSAQLLFLDETTLSMGPRSEVVLDRFVFDPNRGAGRVVLNTGLGVFRFISGSQQSSSYEVRTPVATMGFRGTAVQWTVVTNPNGSQTAQIQVTSGTVVITFINGQQFTLQAGEAIDFNSVTGASGPYKFTANLQPGFNPGTGGFNPIQSINPIGPGGPGPSGGGGNED